MRIFLLNSLTIPLQVFVTYWRKQHTRGNYTCLHTAYLAGYGDNISRSKLKFPAPLPGASRQNLRNRRYKNSSYTLRCFSENISADDEHFQLTVWVYP